MAFKSLAEQCSDHEAIEKIVTHLFGVFNGRYMDICFYIFQVIGPYDHVINARSRELTNQGQGNGV